LSSRSLTIIHQIYLISFLYALAVSSSTILVPLFAQNMGASYINIGIIASFQSLLFMFSSILGGYFSDRFKKTHVISISVGFESLAIFALIFSGDLYQIILLRCIAGICMGLYYPANEALVSSVSDVSNRVKNFSFFYISETLGVMFGALIGGSVANIFGIKQSFIFSSIIMFCAFGLANFSISPKYTPKKVNVISFRESFASLSRSFKTLSLIMIPYGSLLGVILYVFPAYVNNLSFTPFWIGILFMFFRIGRIIGAFAVRYTSSKGDQMNIIVSGILFISSFLLLSSFDSFELLAVSLIGAGIAGGLLFPTALNLATKISPENKVGITIGSLEASIAAGMMVGPLFTSFLLENSNYGSPFVISSIFGLIILVVGITWKKYHSNIN